MFIRSGQDSTGNWKQTGKEMWQINSDPGFVNAANDNFQLGPDSEIFKHLPNFKPIPFERIGFEKRSPNVFP
ncbi:MAG: hypothetical protein ABIP71_04380 [Verrucomicrobiota bacterium]